MQESPQIDGLEIVEEIGHGGMSTVYRAREKVLDRFVAVKVLRSEYASDEDYLKRFRNEAKSARLDALRNLALAQARLGKRKEALATGRILEQETPKVFENRVEERAVVAYTLSEVLCRLGDRKKAKSELERSLRLFDMSPAKLKSNYAVNACWLYFEICKNLGNTEEARKELDKAKAMFTDKSFQNPYIPEAYAEEAISVGELKEAREVMEIALVKLGDKKTQTTEEMRQRIIRRISDIDNGWTKLNLRFDPSRIKGRN